MICPNSVGEGIIWPGHRETPTTPSLCSRRVRVQIDPVHTIHWQGHVFVLIGYAAEIREPAYGRAV
jgi:hypothetical protein